jgi:hypothetical protein
MDAFELLKADHKKVAELFDQMENASGRRKLDVFKRIKSELELHTHVEETIFYPALEKPEPTHDLTLEAYEEHKVVKTLLAELSAAGSATEEWQAKAKVLRENVEHHVDEEENELFDKAEDALTDEEIEELGQRMAAEKARKQGQPRPQPEAMTKSEEAADKPSLISKIADFVGLGSTANKKSAKTASKKSPVKSPEKRSSKGQQSPSVKASPAKRSGKGQQSPSVKAGKRVGAKSKSKSAARSKKSATPSRKTAASSRKSDSKKRASGTVRRKAAKKRSARK